MAKQSSAESGVRYIVDAEGRKTEAVVPISLYERLLEEVEELENVRDYDEAMRDPDFMPWEQAKKLLDV